MMPSCFRSKVNNNISGWGSDSYWVLGDRLYNIRVRRPSRIHCDTSKTETQESEITPVRQRICEELASQERETERKTTRSLLSHRPPVPLPVPHPVPDLQPALLDRGLLVEGPDGGHGQPVLHPGWIRHGRLIFSVWRTSGLNFSYSIPVETEIITT